MCLGIEFALIVLTILLQHGYFGATPIAASSDFPCFYAAGKLALAGTPALAYDPIAHQAAEAAFMPAGAPYLYFFYPPPYLLLCAALALLPYGAAFVTLQLASAIGFILVLRAIARPRGWSWLVLVVAFPATLWTVAMGQNAFLNAALLGGFTLLLGHRPIRAGALLGVLCIKPHLAILTPVALVAGRRWRAIAAAAGVAVALSLASLAVFGPDTWRAFLGEMADANHAYTSGSIKFAEFISVFAGARIAGFSTGTAAATQATATIAMLALAALLFARRGPTASRNAALLACTPLAAPVLMPSDQVLLLVAGAWLLRDARRDKLSVVEGAFLAAAYPLTMLAPPVSLMLPVPVNLVVQLVFAVICLRRAFFHGWRTPRDR